MSPFDRDGHLSELGLELLLAEELPAEVVGEARAHLGQCDPCTARLAAARADDALAPPVRTPRPANRPWILATVAAALAAAVLGWVGLGGSEPDGWRVKGSGLTLEVWVDEGATSRRVRTGEVVHPGERLGFRVQSTRAGHVVVAGVDQQGVAWLGAPATGDAVPVQPTDEAVALPGAVRLDDLPGEERVVAVRCAQPFAFAELAGALAAVASETPAGAALPPVRDGCAQAEVVLDKEPR